MSAKQIALDLILAQWASDGGKHIVSMSLLRKAADKEVYDALRRAWETGYRAKDTHIENALLRICREHNRSVRFSVVRDEGRGKKAKYLVYFDFTIEGVRGQVSFHSFDDVLERFVSGKNRSTWINTRPGKMILSESSRAWCYRLGRQYGIFNRYATADGEPRKDELFDASQESSFPRYSPGSR